MLDDLRTQGDDALSMTFSSNGQIEDGDPSFGKRWRFEGGKVVIRSWPRDKNSLLDRWLGDSAAYSWISDAGEFPLIPEFNQDRSIMN